MGLGVWLSLGAYSLYPFLSLDYEVYATCVTDVVLFVLQMCWISDCTIKISHRVRCT